MVVADSNLVFCAEKVEVLDLSALFLYTDVYQEEREAGTHFGTCGGAPGSSRRAARASERTLYLRRPNTVLFCSCLFIGRL